MKNKYNYLEPEFFENQLRTELYKHRKKLNLTQIEVADLLGKSEKTYQRWESRGKCLTDIYDILKVYQILDFSFTEIIEILKLPRPNMDELEKLCSDEDTWKSIEKDGVYFYVRKNCADMDDSTIEKLLDVLFAERLERRKTRTN